MPNEEMQLEIAEQEKPSGTVEELSDDDLAASLGFITTLTEKGMMPPEDHTDLQEDANEEQESIEGDTDGTPDKDEAQDKEIAEIRMQLEQLLQENDTETTEN